MFANEASMANVTASDQKYTGFQAGLNSLQNKLANSQKAGSGIVGLISKVTGISADKLNSILGVAQSFSHGDVMGGLQGLAGLAGLEGNLADIFDNMDHPLQAAQAAIDMLGLEDTAAGDVVNGVIGMQGAWGSIKDVPSALVSAISHGNFSEIPGLLGGVSEAWGQASKAASLIGNGIDKVTGFFGGNTNIGGWVDGVVEDVNSWLGKDGDNNGNIFSKIGDWVGGLFGGGKPDGATATGGKESGGLFGGIGDWIEGAVETVGSWFGGDKAEGGKEHGSWLGGVADAVGGFIGDVFSGGEGKSESLLGKVVGKVAGWLF